MSLFSILKSPDSGNSFVQGHSKFVMLVHRLVDIAKALDSETLEKVITAVYVSKFPQLSDTLNLQLSLDSTETSYNAFLQSFVTAWHSHRRRSVPKRVLDTSSEVAKRQRLSSDTAVDALSSNPANPVSGVQDNKRFYCLHCGRAYHTKDKCRNAHLPAVPLSPALERLRATAANGRFTLDAVQQALNITTVPRSLVNLFDVVPVSSGVSSDVNSAVQVDSPDPLVSAVDTNPTTRAFLEYMADDFSVI